MSAGNSVKTLPSLKQSDLHCLFLQGELYRDQNECCMHLLLWTLCWIPPLFFPLSSEGRRDYLMCEKFLKLEATTVNSVVTQN